MRNNLNLNLLYNFVSTNGGESQSYYKVLYFFSEAGYLAERTLGNIYDRYPQVGPADWICFDNLDDLGRFALDVCQEVAAPEVFILSAQDYNIGVDTCPDVRTFREMFRRYGTCIDNPEKSKKKNVFGKLFN
jgi:predicted amidohydrolase